ncbi:MAG: hypothetical protein D6712_11135 [Chloroflexi bacterium]|nr:MAG: hypothetical protein D6712_11135 [Chloroflexota bacterium]
MTTHEPLINPHAKPEIPLGEDYGVMQEQLKRELLGIGVKSQFDPEEGEEFDVLCAEWADGRTFTLSVEVDEIDDDNAGLLFGVQASQPPTSPIVAQAPAIAPDESTVLLPYEFEDWDYRFISRMTLFGYAPDDAIDAWLVYKFAFGNRLDVLPSDGFASHPRSDAERVAQFLPVPVTIACSTTFGSVVTVPAMALAKRDDFFLCYWLATDASEDDDTDIMPCSLSWVPSNAVASSLTFQKVAGKVGQGGLANCPVCDKVIDIASEGFIAKSATENKQRFIFCRQCARKYFSGFKVCE